MIKKLQEKHAVLWRNYKAFLYIVKNLISPCVTADFPAVTQGERVATTYTQQGFCDKILINFRVENFFALKTSTIIISIYGW